jgi:hypothetical protein
LIFTPLLPPKSPNLLAILGGISLAKLSGEGLVVRRESSTDIRASGTDSANSFRSASQPRRFEQWREPNLKALEWEMQRDEPETYGRRPEVAPQADVSESLKSKAEMQAEAAQMFDLFSGAVKILFDLGVAPRQIFAQPQPQLEPPAVETMAKPVAPVLRDDC